VPVDVTPGILLHNTTKDSYAFVDSVSGAVAVMTQPLDAAGLTTVAATQTYVEDDTWAAGDFYQALSVPLLNLKIFDVYGGSSNAGFTAPIGWLQMIHVGDTSGLTGNDIFPPRLVDGNNLTLSCVWADPYLYLNCTEGPFSCFAANVWAPQGVYYQAAIMIGGASNTLLNVDDSSFEDLASIDGDAIVHGPAFIKGGRYCIAGLAYFDSSIDVAHGGTILIEPDIVGAGIVWGTPSINLEGPGSAVQNATGGTWAAALFATALSIEGIATGTSYAAGVWTDGITVTSANLDTNLGLQNPRTGSRYSKN
jgi:hypothetical protein